MTSHNSEKRKKLLSKIRALLNMTTERGASEQEALMAAAKAAKLMAEYDISASEAQKSEENENVELQFRDCDYVLWEHLPKVVSAITELCSVRGWKEQTDQKLTYRFVGVGPDAEIAAYLFDICSRAMTNTALEAEKDWALARRWVRYSKARARLAGMAQRLSERILELSWMRHKATGSALVPAKFDLIDTHLSSEGIKLITRNIRSRLLDPNEHKAGTKAADRVNLSRGVSEGDRHKQIG